MQDSKSRFVWPRPSSDRTSLSSSGKASDVRLIGPGESIQRIDEAETQTSSKRTRRRRWLLRACIALPFLLFVALGFVHLVLVILGNTSFDSYSESYWTHRSGHLACDNASCQDDPTQDITPIPCHSHNDYWRKVPFFNAVHVGCTSVEADIWLPQDNNGTDLLVGHHKGSLRKEKTLNSLYINPIEKLLKQSNVNGTVCIANESSNCSGIFETSPNQTLVLLLDFKQDAKTLLPYVNKTLASLRQNNYLSFWDGTTIHPRPVTVVMTGNAQTDLTAQETSSTGGYRDLFFDAPLDKLSQDTSLNYTQSYYASVSFKKTIGHPVGKLSSSQLNTIRSQIMTAKQRGLKARYWDTPSWPTSLRNYVWQTLLDEGADVLNVDDLESAAYGDWRRVRHRMGDA